MQRLVGITAVLCLITAALCVAVTVAARSRSLLPPTDSLAWCEGTPCYAGIVPEKTRWNDATQKFAASADVLGDGRILIVKSAETVTLYRSANERAFESTVEDVWLDFSRELTLGSVIAFFGPPCQITIDASFRSLYISYPFLTAGVNIPTSEFSFGNALNAGWQVRYLSFGDSSGQCKFRTQQGHIVRTAWRGFASISSYYARQP